MKALELKVYERDEYGDYVDTIAPDGRQYLIALEDVEVYCMDKRLTDAELAAEYFSALAHFERMGFNEVSSGDDWDDATWARIAKPMQILHRFATMRSYDE